MKKRTAIEADLEQGMNPKRKRVKTRDRDARKALKILQRFVGSNLFGTAPTDALMKLEICLTDAKIGLGPGLNGLPE